HRPPRRPLDRARELARRRPGATGDAGADGRRRPPARGDRRAGAARGGPRRPHRARAGRGAAGERDRRGREGGVSAGALPPLAAALAGVLAALAAREALLASPAIAGWVRLALEPLRRAGREGYAPSA